MNMKDINIDLPFLNKISSKDKAFLARQLATMLDSGLSLDKSLSVFVNQTRNTKFKQILEGVLSDVEGGLSFSDALKKHPEVFDDVYINIIMSGEAVGKLADVMRRLADTMEKQNVFMSQIKSALYYPGFVLGVMIVIVGVMITQVIPPLKDIFSEFDTELPWTTHYLLVFSDFLVKYWYIVLLVILLLGVVLYFYFATKEGKYWIARFMINLPSDLSKDVYMDRFAQTLSMLLKAGTPVIKSLSITSQVMNNIIYADAINAAASQMERGVPLSVPLEKDKNFNPLVPQMIKVGEETGKIDQVLENLSKYFEEQANTKLKNINSLIEPVLIVIIGLGVSFIVFAIIMPIYQLVQLQ
mgnify:CR=1 FL=1